jgi:hypothetical protein
MEKSTMPLWPFKKKPSSTPQPQLQDQALGELSQMFLKNPSDPTPGSDLLNISRFDFSVSSLRAMDEHLERMRGQQLDQRARLSFVLRAGAYVGEVIRSHTPKPKEWHWLDYKQAAAMNSYVDSLGMSAGTAAVLWDGGDLFIFPSAKVEKFLQNGSEDSVLFYAQVMIAGPPPFTKSDVSANRPAT